ncbi:MAG TPA: hypothetical protein VFE16_12675 [Candidatus Cybelea sp.]|jgi:hypothetical protein|nr:hypothetical protein [Candidatus Cybelea sp.]
MSTRSTSPDMQGGFQGQIPPVEPLLSEFIATLALAAHYYLTEEDGRNADHASAEIAIDVATAAFERVKERLAPDQRLGITQMLTETRLTFVRKRGA